VLTELHTNYYAGRSTATPNGNSRVGPPSDEASNWASRDKPAGEYKDGEEGVNLFIFYIGALRSILSSHLLWWNHMVF
jgi:hypothetical protein